MKNLKYGLLSMLLLLSGQVLEVIGAAVPLPPRGGTPPPPPGGGVPRAPGSGVPKEAPGVPKLPAAASGLLAGIAGGVKLKKTDMGAQARVEAAAQAAMAPSTNQAAELERAYGEVKGYLEAKLAPADIMQALQTIGVAAGAVAEQSDSELTPEEIATREAAKEALAKKRALEKAQKAAGAQKQAALVGEMTTALAKRRAVSEASEVAVAAPETTGLGTGPEAMARPAVVSQPAVPASTGSIESKSPSPETVLPAQAPVAIPAQAPVVPASAVIAPVVQASAVVAPVTATPVVAQAPVVPASAVIAPSDAKQAELRGMLAAKRIKLNLMLRRLQEKDTAGTMTPAERGEMNFLKEIGISVK